VNVCRALSVKYLEHEGYKIINKCTTPKYCKKVTENKNIKKGSYHYGPHCRYMRLWGDNCPLYESENREESAIKVGQWGNNKESVERRGAQPAGKEDD